MSVTLKQEQETWVKQQLDAGNFTTRVATQQLEANAGYSHACRLGTDFSA